MKVINLLEASQPAYTAYDKMNLFNQGLRRENVKACTTQKLTGYYKICLDNDFRRAAKIIEIELLIRNASVYIKPSVFDIDATDFTPYEAKNLIALATDPDAIIEEVAKHPFTDLTSSESLLIYFIWATVLGLDDVVLRFKTYMQLVDTYYKHVPAILDELMKKPGVADTIADILKQL
jgi:hypothetical protein